MEKNISQNIANAGKETLFGWNSETLMQESGQPTNDAATGRVWIVGQGSTAGEVCSMLGLPEEDWQSTRINDSSPLSAVAGPMGPLWLLQLPSGENSGLSWDGDSGYGLARDVVGKLVSECLVKGISHLAINGVELTTEQERGFIVGLELAGYKFLPLFTGDKSDYELPSISMSGFRVDVASVAAVGRAVNVARHLVNVPPNKLFPSSFVDFIIQNWGDAANCQIEHWDQNRLREERMGLLLGVGQASCHQPALIKLCYRHPQAKNNRPMVFVGKGITFDSGGLDLKQASGMRLMKKDMGGAAAVVGLMDWVTSQQLPCAVDFYLPLAENSVGSRAIRPSDVLTARDGQTVEIHNTDAEGRLIMADALSLAAENSELEFIVSVATLTGAAKVGLGNDIAAYFTNDSKMADLIDKSAHLSADFAWRMPLYQPYGKQLQSNFANISNCSSHRYGGAITAALFLQKFVGSLPYAHFDILGWNEDQSAALLEQGGSGQGVQLLIGLVESVVNKS